MKLNNALKVKVNVKFDEERASKLIEQFEKDLMECLEISADIVRDDEDLPQPEGSE